MPRHNSRHPASRRPFTILMEPRDWCTMACRYCYADIYSGRAMTLPALERILAQLAAYLEKEGICHADLIWHGGEPLTAGIDFYRHAFAHCAKAGYHELFCHSFQTNGMLIDEEWCELLKEHAVPLSISLDGPEEVNDLTRVCREKNQGTFGEVMEKCALLDRHGIVYNYLTVVSKANVDRPEELYAFFRSLGHHFKVNPVMTSPHHPAMIEHLGISPRQYGEFLCRLFATWMADSESPLRVGTLDTYIRNVASGKAFNCQHRMSCSGSMIAIDPEGKIKPCNRFDERSQGSLLEHPLAELLEEPPFPALRERAHLLESCHSCSVEPICHGGCPHNALAFFGDFMKKDYFCQSFRMIYHDIEAFLAREGICTSSTS